MNVERGSFSICIVRHDGVEPHMLYQESTLFSVEDWKRGLRAGAGECVVCGVVCEYRPRLGR